MECTINSLQGLQQYMLSADLDLCLVMEMWMKDEDKACMNSTEFGHDGFKVEFINRKNRRGGGIAIVFCDCLTCQ